MPVPSAQGELETLLRRAFAAEVGHSVSEVAGVGVYVERFAHGGVSSGYVSLAWWSTRGIPMLLRRAALPGAVFLIRRTSEQDWPSVRELRLENAKENPVSYGADLRTTLAMTEDDWRTRARRGTGSDTTSVVAVTDDGRWLGIMAAQSCADGSPDALLTGVFVRAVVRGRAYGVADALLAEVLAWAALHAPSIHLWVDRAQAGAPARRFYARHGFRPTGRRRPAAGFPDAEVEEMAAALELPDQP
ncbi:GNAT family N-acetyltransferase [Curtobacterium oceanosedimentum]|uniref:GNAT family N-acetyltransferase n=1 Tax=Curtobacterium oceanosedimentum TaxID=465820 RepID=UPI00128F093D|nr:GNAT family N-acetyltransferase [Curtobacterium oceanosedimentum]